MPMLLEARGAAAMSGRIHDDSRFSAQPSTVALGAEFEADLRCAIGSTAPVLITGPAELTTVLASRIHREGAARGTFLTVDCARTRTVDQLESVFAAASPRGTVFLRDVDRLPSALQALLCFRIAPLGTRVIAATSRDLLLATLQGSFDERLFYRLNQIHLMASLAEHPTGAA
jgi:transcriptional regulator of acetoin/glycerol metabolism